MKHKFVLISFIIIAVAVLLLGREKTYSREIYGTFDTVCSISIHSTSDTTSEYEQLLRKLDSELNAHNANSIIGRLNSGETVTLEPEITDFLCTAVSYTNMLSDYFDITVNPVVESWAKAEDAKELPADIPDKLKLLGADCINIDIDNNTAQITENGASITLGAIAKGYAANVIADKLRQNGISSGIINLGGNVYALGKKPDGSDWNIAVSDPENNAQSALTVKCTDKAVVTSGEYERYFDLNGKHYHHIIDPKTGHPSESGLSSVTVIDRDAELCDVLSTAIFVAGLEKSKSIIDKFCVDAILIENNNIYYTDGLSDKLELNNEKFTLVPLK
ncbi:MAG: FAD:protein FMN transferase [Clostridia bacterium]|nr:FAD:protein FMN transferase [Clostridia bacterium]